MSKIVFENKKGKITIINRLSYPESINERVYHAIASGLLEGFLPVSIRQKRKETRLECVVSGMVPLTQYFSGIVTKKMFLDFTHEIALQIKNCEKNMISANNLDLQYDRIFIDPANKRVKCIFWPLVNNAIGNPPHLFLKKLPDDLNFNPDEDNSYIKTYRSFFSGVTPFSVNNFDKMVLQLSGKKSTSGRTAPSEALSDSMNDYKNNAKAAPADNRKTSIEYNPFAGSAAQINTYNPYQGNANEMNTYSLYHSSSAQGNSYNPNQGGIAQGNSYNPNQGGIAQGNSYNPNQGGVARGNSYNPNQGSAAQSNSYKPYQGGIAQSNSYNPNQGSVAQINSYNPNQGSVAQSNSYNPNQGSAAQGNDYNAVNPVISKETKYTYCAYCGKKNQISFVYCIQCGEKLTKSNKLTKEAPEEVTAPADTGTAVLGDASGGTTVLGYDEPEEPAYPFLTQLRTNSTYRLDKPTYKIGADQGSCDICISDNKYVSGKHADIIIREGRYYIIDLESTNRSFVDGKVIPPGKAVEIFSGTKIRLANEDFIFNIE